MKRYLRRDLLEIHGVPESSTESTNKLVVQVANLIVPDLNLTEADISTSHRLPTNKESFKPIIAKFVRRDTRDAIYKKKRTVTLVQKLLRISASITIPSCILMKALPPDPALFLTKPKNSKEGIIINLCGLDKAKFCLRKMKTDQKPTYLPQ